MRSHIITSPSFLTISTTGFAATIAQIIVLREILVLFYGTEITAGLIFAGWLLWTALGSELSGRWSLRYPPRETSLGCLLIFIAALLPLLVLFLRSARITWSIPAGELPTIGKMIFISVTVTGLFCPLSGALFGVCWAFHRQTIQTDKTSQPLAIYLGEALGAAAGGLIFYYLFLNHLSAFTASLITSVVLLAISRWILRSWPVLPMGRLAVLIWFCIALLIVFAAVFSSHLESISRQWQWGENIVSVRDTPYHNIAVVKKAQQVSVFANGLWLFSEPDRLSAEHAVHFALLQHQSPKTVLLLSGGIAGHAEEILKHSGVQRIDYVEPDPDFIPLTKPHLSRAVLKSLQDKRIHIHNEDAVTFIRRNSRLYDAILMNTGDPITAQMNRFYTKEFFDQVKMKLSPGGIFSFAVSGGEDMMGAAQARFLSSIQKTLGRTFKDMLIIPGNQTRFLAASSKGTLISDVQVLVSRIYERSLDLSYIREDTLQDVLNPFRLDYVKSILGEFSEASINTDFSPICYYYTLMLWSTQWHPFLKKMFATLSAIQPWQIFASLTITGILILTFFWFGRLRFKAAVALSVMMAGAVGMVVQLLLLLVFQIFEGFVYLQLALIIAFFMTGLGIGAAWVSFWKRRQQHKFRPISNLIRIQTIITVFPLFLMFVFYLMHDEFRNYLSSTANGWLFSCLSLAAGMLGGAHFSLAAITYALFDAPSERIGGGLYAMDHAGAAVGVLFASFFILPVYGLHHLLVLLSASSFICLLALLRHP